MPVIITPEALARWMRRGIRSWCAGFGRERATIRLRDSAVCTFCPEDSPFLLVYWGERVSKVFLLEKTAKMLNLGCAVRLLAKDVEIAGQVASSGLIDRGRRLPQRVEKQIEQLAVRATDANTR
jgi:hypothetical protein